MSKSAKNPLVPALLEYMESFLEHGYIFESVENGGGGLQVRFEKNPDPNTCMVFIAGQNASGKSVMGTVLHGNAKEQGFAARSVSMRNRCTSGFESAMIFGDENNQSTGVNSVSAVMNGVNSSRTGGCPAVMILDEPDIGLSEETAGALGEYIGQQMADAQNLKLLVVISHSRPFYQRLIERVPELSAHKIMFGTDRSFDDWLNGPVERLGPEFIENLKARSRDTWRAINAIKVDDD